jgi:hypothetical protein
MTHFLNLAWLILLKHSQTEVSSKIEKPLGDTIDSQLIRYLLTESRLSLGLAIDIEYDVVTDVEFEQVDHEFDLELIVNRKSILISN